MNQESQWDVEIIPVMIPGKDYEEKLMQLVKALLAIVENPSVSAEDGQDREAA